MSLKEAVRFRYLASQLTSEETNRFLLNLSHQQPMLLISALYKHFMSNSTMTQTISGNISDIITSRKPKPRLETVTPRSNPTPKLAHFNDVPITVISIISSFMNQSDYSNFSKMNRSTFLGCHLPNTLQAISFDAVNYSNRHCPFKYQLYPNVKRLDLELCHVPNRLDGPSLPFLNQLEWIHVDGNYSEDTNNAMFFEIIPPCENVKQVACSCLNHEMFAMDIDFLMQCILSRFPNTECLSLRQCIAVDGNLISTMSSLKGLSIEPNNKHLIPILADKLEFLELISTSFQYQRSSDEAYEIHGLNFAKLEQLKLRGVTAAKCIDDIIKTAANLNKLSISNESLNIRFEAASISTMQEVMKRCASLEYIKIEERFIDTALDALIGITNGLTVAQKKRNLKIEVVSSPTIIQLSCSDNLDQCVLSLINALKSKTKHFMFIWRLNSNTQDNIQLVRQLKNKLNESIMIKVTSYKNIVTVAAMNRNCAINGYQESWICQSSYNDYWNYN
eukprot:325011_1